MSKLSERIIVTGGAGFIGSALIRYLLNHTDHQVLNVDKLTYAGDVTSLKPYEKNPNYSFLKADICDRSAMERAFQEFQPTKIMHLAAESHVDRSISGPDPFIQSNIIGTFTLLEVSRNYFEALRDKSTFRFLHVSTDEVYGFLGETGYFSETTPYNPSSPYSSSKAASDHLARAWQHTYKLPVVVTNCSNNYGPWQFPEKLIPVIIHNALANKPIPIYGEGKNIRDWLFVDDHARALWLIVQKAPVGETYLIGGHNEKTNLELTNKVCEILDSLIPATSGSSYKNQITFVKDRAGHDFRYAIDPRKLESELGWRPEETFESGMKKTVMWYLEHRAWLDKNR